MKIATKKLGIYTLIIFQFFFFSTFSQNANVTSTFSIVGWTSGNVTPLSISNSGNLNTNVTLTGAPNNPGDGSFDSWEQMNYTYSVYLVSASASFLIGTHVIYAQNDYGVNPAQDIPDWYFVTDNNSSTDVAGTGNAYSTSPPIYNSYNINTTDPIGYCVPPGSYQVNIVLTQDNFNPGYQSIQCNYSWYAYANNSPTVSSLSDGVSSAANTWSGNTLGSTSYTFAKVALVNVTSSTPAISLPSSILTCGTLASATVTVPPSNGTCTPEYTYLWSNGTTSQTATGLATGAYTVTVTTAIGTTASASTTVTVNPIPNATINPTSSEICTGSTQVLTVASNSGSTYHWSGDAINVPTNSQITVSPTNNSSGVYFQGFRELLSMGSVINETYVVTVTSNAGCTATGSAIVSVDPKPIVTINNSIGIATASQVLVSCTAGQGTSTLTGYGFSNFTPCTYHWSNNATTQSITASIGTYSVSVTDAHLCKATNAPCSVVCEKELVAEGPIEGSIYLYPNPANNNITIDYTRIENSSYSMHIFNLLGEEVINPISVSKIAGEQKLNINVDNLIPGVYIFEIAGVQSYRSKFVKQ